MKQEQNKSLTNPIKTQLEIISEKLAAIATNITTGDKTLLYSLPQNDPLLPNSPPTVSRYLSGKGVDADTALSLLEWFNERIKMRQIKMEEAIV